ncbi:hypothetical protein FBZ96_1011124 [Bradyrhizobium stylosanthis]|uniref:Uncharacterized protein n=1 Tax=Bradyrhizobium stylosanthis TaxID=1803665 RepID=A0A560ED51_9BRAD|nr:hypothetical protein FBZ96_1011124 [Bradyrhizobium stylosanthis]
MLMHVPHIAQEKVTLVSYPFLQVMTGILRKLSRRFFKRKFAKLGDAEGCLAIAIKFVLNTNVGCRSKRAASAIICEAR